MIRVKPGVSLDNVHPQIFLAIGLAAPIWQRYGAPELWVTAANEEGHSTGPRGFHRLPNGTCQAADLRTWNIPEPADRHKAVEELAEHLGRYFDVLYEKPGQQGEHVHLQWDEERPGTNV